MLIDEAERLIEASPNHCLLRRVPAPQDWAVSTGSHLRRALFVDTETTGLEETDEVIELAIVPFEYDRDTGRIVSVDISGAFNGLRQPSIPIPLESTRVHGITDADAAGQSIDDARVTALAASAQLVIAHNAAFDRPMVEKLWPTFEAKNWACSLEDIDWKTEGLGSAKLDYLLMRQGWFHDGHRALSDVLASIFLLTQPLPISGKIALTTLLENARRPLWAVRAEETAFEQRAALKARGYRWDAGEGDRAKAWWKLTDDTDTEISWLHREIYRDERNIPVIKAPATRRYSSRLWPS